MKRFILTKDDPASDTSRIKPGTLDLYVSQDGETYQRLDLSTYQLKMGLEGLAFQLNTPMEVVGIKAYSKFDERNEDGSFNDLATFKNTLGDLIKAEQEVFQETLGYGYDAVGNRTYESVTKTSTQGKNYTYYANSNRLLTDGKYAFVYDDDGNLIRKGNKFTLAGETVSFIADGRSVEYWEYRCNLRNQLTKVTKNGQLVATYAYDGLGLRVSATTTITSKTTGDSKTTTRDYLFDLGDRVIYDRVISTTGQLPADEDPETSIENSYVFANGTHFAKVEGAIGTTAEVYYYHNDHLGSPMAITDSQGNLAWSQDYLPYGEALNEAATVTKTRFTFTGKELDPATGLMNHNARWYDPDLGRFMTEDTYVGNTQQPPTLNRYTYVIANPVRFMDPDGHHHILILADSNPKENRYKGLLLDDAGKIAHEFEVGRNAKDSKTMNMANYTTDHEAPPGTYDAGATRPGANPVSVGDKFIPLSDEPGGNTIVSPEGSVRTEIGIHAGRLEEMREEGTFHQTLGCLRTTPADVDAIDNIFSQAMHNFKGDVKITILNRFDPAVATKQLISVLTKYSQYLDDSVPFPQLDPQKLPEELKPIVPDPDSDLEPVGEEPGAGAEGTGDSVGTTSGGGGGNIRTVAY